MKPSKGYYCIIQYCPDLSRLEAANIGVLVFCPERDFLKARTSSDNERIIRFFGADGHDWSRVDSQKLGIEERLQTEQPRINTVEDLRKFAALRANEVQITEPRPVRVCDPEDELEELFRELVCSPQQHEQAETA